ncbi:hypothetical protein HAX54_024347 [Datura stramonium]|uniref:Uncharacterized protein n=1 Tax=Datura stramonium TaxID=4076 RepID=A0ABS8S5C7_DATST|nr:hypothetical protein [Datura stramonium]
MSRKTHFKLDSKQGHSQNPSRRNRHAIFRSEFEDTGGQVEKDMAMEPVDFTKPLIKKLDNPFIFRNVEENEDQKLFVLCGLSPLSLDFSLPVSFDDDSACEDPLGSSSLFDFFLYCDCVAEGLPFVDLLFSKLLGSGAPNSSSELVGASRRRDLFGGVTLPPPFTTYFGAIAENI